MAGIDKIYGTQKQYDQLKKWLEEYCPEGLGYLYERPSHPNLTELVALSNFPVYIDKVLWDNCPLLFVKLTLKEQYGRRGPR